MKLSIVVAISENRVIGVDNKLPWNLPADLKRFKKITMGHPIIMGRKTFESIGKPLPGRTSIVISRQASLNLPEGVLLASDIENAKHCASVAPGGAQEAFVIGGGEIFREALPQVDRIYLTLIHQKIAGDVSFPEIPAGKFKAVNEEKFPREGLNPAYDFITLDRIQ